MVPGREMTCGWPLNLIGKSTWAGHVPPYLGHLARRWPSAAGVSDWALVCSDLSLIHSIRASSHAAPFSEHSSRAHRTCQPTCSSLGGQRLSVAHVSGQHGAELPHAIGVQTRPQPSLAVIGTVSFAPPSCARVPRARARRARDRRPQRPVPANPSQASSVRAATRGIGIFALFGQVQLVYILRTHQCTQCARP